MPFRSSASTGPRRSPDLDEAVAEYLDLSRSPLRHGEPEWFALAEQAAWERLRIAAGLPSEPSPAAPVTDAPPRGRRD